MQREKMMLNKGRSTYLWLLLLLVGISRSLANQNNMAFQTAMENLQLEGLTKDEINAWWAFYIKTNFPRVFPVCVRRNEKGKYQKPISPLLAAALDILNGDAWPRIYDPKLHSWDSPTRKEVFQDLFQIYDIRGADGAPHKVPPANFHENHMNLQNWATIEMAVNLASVQAIFIQSIGGPLGLPIGELLTGLPCDGTATWTQSIRNKYTLPCTYSPRASSKVPHVLVFDLSGAGKVIANIFTFQFRWTEAQCQETFFFQFIVSAVVPNPYTPAEPTIHTFLTPVVHLMQMESKTGLPHPYHPSLTIGVPGRQTSCQYALKSSRVARIEAHDIRIFPNPDYDLCLTEGVGRGTGELDKYTCPPGYFRCQTTWRDESQWKKMNNKQWELQVKLSRESCQLGELKTITNTTTPAPTTPSPTKAPTTPPPTTRSPTKAPPTTPPPTTPSPTKAPTRRPTTPSPTKAPPTTPSPTKAPTRRPTTPSPTKAPTRRPTTPLPTKAPPTTPRRTTPLPTKAPPPTTPRPTTTSSTKTPHTTPRPTTPPPTKAPPANRTTTSVPTIITTSTTKYQLREKQLSIATVEHEKKQTLRHGDLCILVFLIMLPTSIHIARYYKDFPDFKSLGLGFWIIAHVSLNSFSLVTVWASFGFVVGTGAYKLGNVDPQHLVLGGITTLLLHIQFYTAITAQFQNSDVKAFSIVYTHSAGGYVMHVFAWVCLFNTLSSAGLERVWFSLAMLAILIVGKIVGHIVELRQDKILEVAHRGQWPILQRVVMDDGYPPFAKVKIAVLVIPFLLQIALYVYMEVEYSVDFIEFLITDEDIKAY